MTDTRPWKLVAPWYRWERQLSEENLARDKTHPVFQKFDQPDYVKGFTKDPQRSLKFLEDVDRVFNVNLTPAPILSSGPFKNKLTRLYAPAVKTGKPEAKDATLVPTGLRKLFLATHKRFYLVVCELHCDAPGFPTTTPDQVCEAGFTVRRRSFLYPAGAKKEAVKLLKNITQIQGDIAFHEETSPARGLKLKRRSEKIKKMKADGNWESKVAGLKAQLAEARQEIVKWKDEKGVEAVHEGWVASQFENIGSWQPVEETPQELREATYPLYALFPDPNIPNHAAAGKNIYFGAVPTSSLDTDERGNARFDDQVLYEIRCYVRRHKSDCPRRDDAPDCPGDLVWSEPTETYRLASHNDLIGTSQRAVTIQMPNLEELAAQVAALPLNKFSPVKVVQPQSMNFDVADGKAEGGSVGFPQICFFSIPLITIVAYFLLNLFLPIVVFLFGLYFLLLLRFCILPSVSIDLQLKAQLDALPPSIELDADFDVNLNLGFTAEELNDALKAGIALDARVSMDAEAVAKLDDFSNAPLVELGTKMNAVSSVPESEANTVGVDLVAALEFEPRVEVSVQ